LPKSIIVQETKMTKENTDSTDEPKIIVDEDWKSQVEREKEELKTQEQTGQDQAPDSSSEEYPIPPASFTVLLSTLATQAMMGLGMFPDPASGKPTVNRPMAKHFIDTISMLEEKTKGNLDGEEASQISDSLHQLRMAYMATADSKPEPETPKKSTIELP